MKSFYHNSITIIKKRGYLIKKPTSSYLILRRVPEHAYHERKYIKSSYVNILNHNPIIPTVPTPGPTYLPVPPPSPHVPLTDTAA